MGSETERKFLTNAHLKKSLMGAKGTYFKQGYISSDPEKTIRIRVAEDKAFITFKGKGVSFTRPEFEYEVPVEDAEQMLNFFADNIIEKTRYKIEFQGFVWEVDIFHGENEGLIIAEIELDSEEEVFQIPVWISKEVTGDKRYYNSYIAQNAYKYWKAS